MTTANIIKIYLYTRFERFWHWFQALMIITLIVTGLEIH
jgi:Ni,Fe-hydrogenase I cytochrome b subunit